MRVSDINAPTVIGAVALDLLILPNQRAHSQWGGVCANLACALGNLGMSPIFVSPTYRSDLGHGYIQSYLRENKVVWRTLPYESEIPVFLAWLDENGNSADELFADNDTFSFYTPEAIASLDIVNDARAIVSCTDLPVSTIDFLCRRSQAMGGTFWLVGTNPDEAYKLKHLSVPPFFVSMNSAEFAKLGHAGLPGELIAAGGALLVTRGSEGSTIYFNGGAPPIHRIGSNINSISTVGAGDVFSAGLIASYLKSRNWKIALEAAESAVERFLVRPSISKFPINRPNC